MPNHPAVRHLAGFDSLRLMAAVSVMFSHSFLIATGSEETEPFVRLLGPGNIIGLYGVFTFFSISGFLLARSLERNPCAITYAINRTLRILPAFLFCTLLTVLIIGPIFSTLRPGAYFTSPVTFDFVKTSINSMGEMPLPGVFSYSDGGLALSVNGSLWSLRCEALSYVFLLVAWLVLRSGGIVTILAVAWAAATLISAEAYNLMPEISYTLPYFAGGVLMNWVYRSFGVHWQGAVFSLLALVASAFFGWQSIAFALFGAYLIVYAGARSNFATRAIDKLGDCSYGIYLYGWPTQQIVRQIMGITDPMTLLVLSVPAALMLALISCHIVEKPAMGMKQSMCERAKSLVNRAMTALGPGQRAAAWTSRLVFVIGALIVLNSRMRSYYFLESLGAVLAATLASALIMGLAYRLTSRFKCSGNPLARP